ncbi:hypothetical protein GCM10022251_77660 [Phytohabitans flavus]|uniref:Uncharacterized protein n=1 Tax=Phytohabitans flavus TaxID=1076124 RepID=A0A6F8XIM1_9ACTN|nr:hypothetical protein [Phytohabitans flavus]BCB73641.1 hypothetical protein Pflav_000510 [Phytohabitans flavus]
MAVPIVPVVTVIATSAAGTAGLLAGAAGGIDFRRAHARKREHEALHAGRYAEHLAEVERANAALHTLGHTLRRAKHDVRDRIGDFLARVNVPARSDGYPIVDGVTFTNEHALAAANRDVDVSPWVCGAASAAAAGTATPMVLRAAAQQWGTASTGAPIIGLHGAARQAATDALFGGGSRASGGYGRAVGAKMLKASAIGPGLFVVGITLMTQGIRQLEAADDLRQVVELKIKKLNRRDEVLRGVQGWAQEKHDTITRAIDDATDALDILESEPYDESVHFPRFQEALMLTTTVRLLVEIAIAESDTIVGDDTDELAFTYRDDKETPDA